MNRSEGAARRMLWLFPAWVRATRGEEAVSLVLDLLPPGARRLPLRSRLDLVRAGFQARRRGTPPLRVWGALAFARRKPSRASIPVEWRPWLVSVINRRRFVVQCALVRGIYLPTMAVVWLFGGVLIEGTGQMVGLGFVYLAMWIMGIPVFALQSQQWREAVVGANGLAADGRPLPPDQVQLGWGPASCPNAPVWQALGAGALMSGGYGTAHLAMGDHSSTMAAPWVALGCIAGCVGLALAAAGRTFRAIDKDSPASVSPPRPGWTHQILPVAIGLAVGYPLGWVVAEQAMSGRIHLIAVWAVPSGLLVLAAQIWRAQRRIARRVGLWDLFPSTAPQVVVAVPPPTPVWWTPSGPGRPAAG